MSDWFLFKIGDWARSSERHDVQIEFSADAMESAMKLSHHLKLFPDGVIQLWFRLVSTCTAIVLQCVLSFYVARTV